jgi:hypothetical protein
MVLERAYGKKSQQQELFLPNRLNKRKMIKKRKRNKKISKMINLLSSLNLKIK